MNQRTIVLKKMGVSASPEIKPAMPNEFHCDTSSQPMISQWLNVASLSIERNFSKNNKKNLKI